MEKKSITLIGPLGEVGGVSIHLNRLKILLEEEFKFYVVNESKIYINELDSLNFRKLDLLKYFKFIIKSNYIHVHSGNVILRLFHLIVCTFLNKKIIVTLHSFRYTNFLQNWLLKKLSYLIICVSEEIDRKIRSEKTIILNAFIPPIVSREPELRTEFVSLLNKKKKNGISIISGNAFRIVYQNGQDLYGINQLIELSKLFKKNARTCFIVFVIGSLVNGEEDYKRYNDKIKKEGLTEYILLLNAQISFVKLIEISDLVMRPTLSDGDALTIREAIYLNKPVIASDVVKRPDATILYKSCNIDDLYKKTLMVLKSKKEIKKNSESINNNIKNIYLKLYN